MDNYEKLKRLTELKSQIESLEQHIDYIGRPSQNGTKWNDEGGSKASLKFTPSWTNDSKQLKNEFLPIQAVDFVSMYLVKAKEGLAKLKQEFESI